MSHRPTGGDVALACAGLLLDELVRSGVVHVVVCPGSRSTPLALAAARHPRVSVHVVLDERSAGFVALGIARATHRPAAVVTTSGTAAANLHPAVVEADLARVPLVLLTADRPPELRGVGANQAIDQIALFGRAVRLFLDTGVPAEEVEAGRWWRSFGARAAAAALGTTGGLPGPVHLNVPLREPLVPSGSPCDLGADAGGRADGAPWHRIVADVPPSPDPVAVAQLLDEVRESHGRGLVLAGATSRPAPSWIGAAAALGWPLLAEPHSGLRRPGTVSCGQIIAAVAPDAVDALGLVVQVGAAPTSRSLAALERRARRLIVVDPDGVVGDPGRHAALTLGADAEAVAHCLLAELGEGPTGERTRPAEESSAAWWTWAEGRARAAVDATLEGWTAISELRVTRDVAAAVPDSGALVVASSLPIRHLDCVMAPRESLLVVANRGASGIDGLVSTAAGVALAGLPTVLLLGDLALLHDAGALLWLGRRDLRLVLVVLDNRGGGIFELLPQRALPEHERLFVASHDVDLAALARAAGAAATVLDEPQATVDVVRRALDAGGVQVVVVPSERRLLATHQAELSRAVAVALRR